MSLNVNVREFGDNHIHITRKLTVEDQRLVSEGCTFHSVLPTFHSSPPTGADI